MQVMHEGRRNYSSQEQQALVDLATLGASDDWQAEQQRIRDAANAKRAAARAEQEPPNPEGTNQHTKERLVEPHIEARPTNEPVPAPPQRDWSDANAKKSSQAKATRIGVKRAAVERAEQIERFDSEHGTNYAEQVKNEKIAAAKAIREIRKATIVGADDPGAGAVGTAGLGSLATPLSLARRITS